MPQEPNTINVIAIGKLSPTNDPTHHITIDTVKSIFIDVFWASIFYSFFSPISSSIFNMSIASSLETS